MWRRKKEIEKEIIVWSSDRNERTVKRKKERKKEKKKERKKERIKELKYTKWKRK